MNTDLDVFFATAGTIGGSISTLAVLLLPVLLDRDAFRGGWIGSITAIWFFDIAVQCFCTAALPAALCLMALAHFKSDAGFISLLQADLKASQLSLWLCLFSGMLLCVSRCFVHRWMPFIRLVPMIGTVLLMSVGQSLLSTASADGVKVFIIFSIYASFGLILYAAIYALGLKAELKMTATDIVLKRIDIRVRLFATHRIPLPFLGERWESMVGLASEIDDDAREEYVKGLFSLFKDDYRSVREAASKYARAAGIVTFIGLYLTALAYAYRPAGGYLAAAKIGWPFLAIAALLTYAYIKRLFTAYGMVGWVNK